jgi:hypothetical protein
MALEGLHCGEILTNIGRAILGQTFDVNNERAACEARSAAWNLVTNWAFALASRKTTENLDRIGRSQDLLDAEWLLASSPAFKYVNPNISPCICAVALFEKNVFVFVSTYFYVHTLDEQQTTGYNILQGGSLYAQGPCWSHKPPWYDTDRTENEKRWHRDTRKVRWFLNSPWYDMDRTGNKKIKGHRHTYRLRTKIRGGHIARWHNKLCNKS